MGKKPVFEKVIKDSITADLLDQGLSRLLGGGWKTTLNKSGPISPPSGRLTNNISL